MDPFRFYPPVRPPVHLTVREWQIVRLVLRGLQVKGIAGELGLAPGYVRQRLQGLYRKLGINSMTELAIWAMQQPVQEWQVQRREPRADEEPAA